MVVIAEGIHVTVTIEEMASIIRGVGGEAVAAALSNPEIIDYGNLEEGVREIIFPDDFSANAFIRLAATVEEKT